MVYTALLAWMQLGCALRNKHIIEIKVSDVNKSPTLADPSVYGASVELRFTKIHGLSPRRYVKVRRTRTEVGGMAHLCHKPHSDGNVQRVLASSRITPRCSCSHLCKRTGS